jgi:hypothetical protein
MYQYKQLIQEPTRVTRNTKSLIDHLFTNKPENIILTGVSKIAISDHHLIYGVRKFPSLKANTRIIEFRDFKNLNERASLDDVRSIGTLNLQNNIQNNKGNLKETWKSINQGLNRNPKSNKIVLIKDTNEQDIKSEDIANAFNEHFINIGSNLAQLIPQTHYPPEHYINSVDKIFTFREITEEELLTLKLNMSTNKATGMDSLSIKVVKLSAPLIINNTWNDRNI